MRIKLSCTPVLIAMFFSLILGVFFATFPASADAKTIELKMATDSGTKGTPSGNSLDLWAKLIEEKTNGEIKVNVYYQGQLGGQQEIFDQFVMGNIDLMINWPMTSYDKRLSILYTPYMVLSWEDALTAFKPGGWLNNIFVDLFEKIGLKYLACWPEGFPGVATKGKYATTIEAAKQLKVRTQPVFPNDITMQALGYNTATIDWNELYTAIQTGVVDGDSGNIIFWDYEYFRDILDYFVHTQHQFITAHLLMNLEAWNRLDPKNQSVIKETAQIVMEKQFSEAKATDEGYRKKAIDAGIEYIALSKDEKAQAIKVAREKVWPEIEKVVGPEIMSQIRKNASKP